MNESPQERPKELKVAQLPEYLGQEIAVSDWIPVTQERIQAFADATGDQQFIHTDAERAAKGPFGTTIAHGFLVLSMLAGEFLNHGGMPKLSGAGMMLNYGLNRVRFASPVRVGSRLRCHAVLQRVDEGAGYVQLTVQNTIEIEGESKPACISESLFRVYL